MKKFELVAGNEKMVKLVQINGTTALAKDAKPRGKLGGIVKGTDDTDGKVTYYLCMVTEEGFGIYATGVEREINKITDLLNDYTVENGCIEIECTEGISRKTGQKFFKIVVTSI